MVRTRHERDGSHGDRPLRERPDDARHREPPEAGAQHRAFPARNLVNYRQGISFHQGLADATAFAVLPDPLHGRNPFQGEGRGQDHLESGVCRARVQH